MLWWLAVLVTLCYASPRLPKALHGDKNSSVDVWNTAGYKKASDMLTNSINFSVDPCQDFFEFTCGNWIASHPIPEHKTSYTQFGNLSDTVQEQMRDAFESPEKFGSNSMNILKYMYKKCMDKDELDRVGAKRLISMIRSYGVWPMLDEDKWRPEDFDLTSLLIHVTEVRALDVFVTNYVTLDNKNVSRRLIEIDQADLGLGSSTRDYYLDREKHGKKISAYKQFMINKMKLIHQDAGVPFNEEKISKDVEEIIELETKMAKILIPEDERRDFQKMYNLRHLSEMQKLMPLVDWIRYFSSVTPYSVHGYLMADPDIIIVEVDYLRRITDLLKSTDPRVITNYVFMRFTSTWSGELGERYEDNVQEFNRAMYGKKHRAPKWKDCTTATLHRLQYAAGAIYVRKMFNEQSKNVTLEMVNDLQETFREMLLENDWMDEKTKKTALNKANEMLRQIAYPDFILSDEKLDEHYKGLSVRETDSYSEMVEKLTRWSIEYNYNRLTQPVDRTEYNFNAAIVNAYYSSQTNAIKFPAAILQAPFFHYTFPRALNYGGIGAVIGHEITHGFDDQGRQFDEIGNLREWWDEDVKKRFLGRAQCIVDQYGKIQVPGTGLKINGRLTQGENIADYGGVKQALRAYRRYLKKHGEEKRIEGLEQFNNEQMFFLGYATVWCGHMTQDSLINLILTDAHSPQRYRVNQVLANRPEFAEAFHCEVGSPMNPTERCGVW